SIGGRHLTKAITAPPEWRRRAGLVPSRPVPPWLGAVRGVGQVAHLVESQDDEGGWPGPSGHAELAPSALNGWACLAGDRPAAAGTVLAEMADAVEARRAVEEVGE